MPGTLTPLFALEGHTDRVWHAAVHPAHELLATCGGDRSVRLWAPRRGGGGGGQSGGGGGQAAGPPRDWACCHVSEDFTQRTVRSCAWSPDGRFLACASFDATATVWGLSAGGGASFSLELVATLEGHESEVKGVAWSPSGALLATCSRDKSVWLWDFDEAEGEFECAAVLQGHAGDVKTVAWHPARELLLSASYDNSVRAWGESPDEADWVCTGSLAGHESTVWALAFSPCGGRLATASDDRTVAVWRAAPPARGDRAAAVIDGLAWTREARLAGHHSRAVFSVAWGGGGSGSGGGGGGEAAGGHHRSFIASAGADDAIRVFAEEDAPAGGRAWACVGGLDAAHQRDVNHVLWHPRHAGVLISCGDDNAVRVWQWTYTEPAEGGEEVTVCPE